MSWAHKIVDLLAREPLVGYLAGQQPATEPTALAALLLLGSGRGEAVQPVLQYLRGAQHPHGSVPVRASYDGPNWTTSLAVLVWVAAGKDEDRPRILRAIAWLEGTHSKTQPRHPDTGHNTTLDGWPWVEGTHAWLEPTSFSLLAFRAAGEGVRPRAREAAAMILDRQLPAGGANYGNTTVFGQVLMPHQHPSGVSLLALAGEPDQGGRAARSIGYLQRTLGPDSGAASLAWGLIGLAAHGVLPPDAAAWLEWAAARVETHDRSPHKQALLALAALGADAPRLFGIRANS